MDIGFDFSIKSVEIDEIFLLSLEVIWTLNFGKVSPSQNLSIFFYHASFFVFWLCFFKQIIKTFFKEKSLAQINESKIYKIFEKNCEKLIVMIPLKENAVPQAFIERLCQIIDKKTHIVVFNHEEISFEKIRCTYYHLDLFTEHDPFLKKVSCFKNLMFFIFSPQKVKNNENYDYENALAASILRTYCKNSVIAAKICSDQAFSPEWNDSNFVVASDSFRANYIVKSFLHPGFSIFFTNLLRSQIFPEEKSEGPCLKIECFTQDLHKLYINKRFSDISYFLYFHYKVLLVGIQRSPLSPKNSPFVLLLNPNSLYIEENDYGIFLLNSPNDLLEVWRQSKHKIDFPMPEPKNTSHSNSLTINQFAFEQENLSIFKSSVEIPLLSNRLFIRADKETLKYAIKLLRKDNKNLNIVWADYNVDKEEEFCKENLITYHNIDWENCEEISKLGINNGDSLMLFSFEENNPDISDGKMLKIIEFLEDKFPFANYIVELINENNLKLKHSNETLKKFNILKNPLFISAKICVSAIMDELLLIFLNQRKNTMEAEFFQRILTPELCQCNEMANKENSKVKTFKVLKEFENIQYYQIFKIFTNKKLLPIGVFRENNEKNKEFCMIPALNDKLKENDVILCLGDISEGIISSNKAILTEENIFPFFSNKKESFEPISCENFESNPMDILSIAKRVIEEDEHLNIKDQDLLSKFLKENNITKKDYDKLLEQNKILKGLVDDYEKAFNKFNKKNN